jgi:hypothetical protein
LADVCRDDRQRAGIHQHGLAVVFSLVCVAGNAMAMSLRRTREVAVLAIGFQRWTILGGAGQALAIALLGGIWVWA